MPLCCLLANFTLIIPELRLVSIQVSLIETLADQYVDLLVKLKVRKIDRPGESDWKPILTWNAQKNMFTLLFVETSG